MSQRLKSPLVVLFTLSPFSDLYAHKSASFRDYTFRFKCIQDKGWPPYTIQRCHIFPSLNVRMHIVSATSLPTTTR